MSKIYTPDALQVMENLSNQYPQWQQMTRKGYLDAKEMRDVISSLKEMMIRSGPGGVSSFLSTYCDYFDTVTRRKMMTPLREFNRVYENYGYRLYPDNYNTYYKKDTRVPLDELPSSENIRDTILATIDVSTIISHVVGNKYYPFNMGVPTKSFLRDFKENGGDALVDALFSGVPIEDIVVPHRKEVFSTRSFNYRVTGNTNPRFLLYHMVFDTPRNETLNAYTLVRELEKYDKYLDEREVEDYLRQLYRDGRLNERSDGYVLA